MKTKDTKFLFVTCCLEESRAEVLRDVVDNLAKLKYNLGDNLTIFDNGSTIDWVVPMLEEKLGPVHVANKNVGYWSAIHWWLNNVEQDDFTYIIESDMMHYDFEKLFRAERYLQYNNQVGSFRCHEYDIQNWHLYDKNQPQEGSRKNIWQSHTNKVTNEPIRHAFGSDILEKPRARLYLSNFLTQLPALNRTKTIKECFDELAKRESFSEFDFQKMYWEKYQCTGIIDKGIFHCDAGSWGKKVITGSWTDPNELKRIGYQPTRIASIMSPKDYTVTCTKS